LLRPIYLCALAASLVGCAGSSTQLRSDNERLHAQVAELRAETRVQRRTIRDLENQLALVRDRAREARAPADVPELPIEVRRPDAQPPRGGPQEFASSASGAAGGRVAKPPEDDEEVVVLTNIGSGRRAAPGRSQAAATQPPATRSSRREAPRADAPVPTTTERLPAMDGAVPTVASRLGDGPRQGARPDPRGEYRRYLEALRAGNHAFAITGFRNFVEEYPRHELADNAQYWLGEAYYDQDDFHQALAEFRKVVTLFPGGGKVPDALLKIGFCHLALGDEDAARRVLRRVAERYADTNPARLAADRLKSLGE
jgi:tol-pal system protein YbgF